MFTEANAVPFAPGELGLVPEGAHRGLTRGLQLGIELLGPHRIAELQELGAELLQFSERGVGDEKSVQLVELLEILSAPHDAGQDAFGGEREAVRPPLALL